MPVTNKLSQPLTRRLMRPGMLAGRAMRGGGADYEDGIHLDFVHDFHYVKVPGRPPIVADFESLFNFTGDNLSYYRGANGLLLPSVTNKKRREFDLLGNPLGLLIEGQRTNQILHSRDHTNAAWVKVTMTAAKDQVGEDGVANSASSLLATGAAATSLQTIVQAATDSTLSLSIKRLVGTGTIGIAQDGVTFTDVTSQINSSTWTRVTLRATQLNPALGIRLGTSGDKIAVDFAGFEAGSSATSRIPTTTASVLRAVDAAVRVVGAEASSINTVFIEGIPPRSFSTNDSMWMYSYDSNAAFSNFQTMLLSANGTAYQLHNYLAGSSTGIITGGVPVVFTAYKVSGGFDLNNYALSLNGAIVGTDLIGALPINQTHLRLGIAPDSASGIWFGHIRRFDYWPERKPNGFLQAITG